LTEQPLFIRSGGRRNVCTVAFAVQTMNPSTRAAFYDLHLAPPQLYCGVSKEQAIWNSNALPFGGWFNEYGLFMKGARFNHSCRPNLVNDYVGEEKGGMVFIAAEPIEAGEELTIKYFPTTHPKAERQKYFVETFGRPCACDLCALTGDEAKEMDEKMAVLQEVFASLDAANPGMDEKEDMTGEIDLSRAPVNPVADLEIIKTGLSVMNEIGLYPERSTLAKTAAKICSTWSDKENTQAWAKKAIELFEFEGGEGSSEAAWWKKKLDAPERLWDWGRWGTKTLIGP
jgi:hypothetical protein